MKKHEKKNQGFTLVELLVVVAIIGVLTAIALPGFNKYQAKARQAEGRSSLTSFYMGIEAYLVDGDRALLDEGNGSTLTTLDLDSFADGNRWFHTHFNDDIESGIPVAAKRVGGAPDADGGQDFNQKGTQRNSYTVETEGSIWVGDEFCTMQIDEDKVLTMINQAGCPSTL